MQCARGFYRDRERCRKCPVGGLCHWNATVITILLTPGYWRPSTLTGAVLPCKPGANRTTSCVGGLTEHVCASNHTGVLCSICTEYNQYFLDDHGRCTNCPEPTTMLWILFGALMVTAFVFCSFGWLWFGPYQEPLPSLSQDWHYWVRFLVHEVKASIDAIGLQSKLKIVISFYQAPDQSWTSHACCHCHCGHCLPHANAGLTLVLLGDRSQQSWTRLTQSSSPSSTRGGLFGSTGLAFPTGRA